MSVYGIDWLKSNIQRGGAGVSTRLQAHSVITFLFKIHCDLV